VEIAVANRLLLCNDLLRENLQLASTKIYKALRQKPNSKGRKILLGGTKTLWVALRDLLVCRGGQLSKSKNSVNLVCEDSLGAIFHQNRIGYNPLIRFHSSERSLLRDVSYVWVSQKFPMTFTFSPSCGLSFCQQFDSVGLPRNDMLQ